MNKYAIYCDSLEDEQMLKDWIKKESTLKGYDDFNYTKTYFCYPAKDSLGFTQNMHAYDAVLSGYTRINIKGFLKEFYMKELTELPKEWVVYNDGTQQFKDTVINYLNKYYLPYYENTYRFTGWVKDTWYGVVDNIRFQSNNPGKATKLTLDQFIKLTSKEMKTELLGLPIIKGEKHHLEAFAEDLKKIGYKISISCIKQYTGLKHNCYGSDVFLSNKDIFRDIYMGAGLYDPTTKYPIKEFQLPSDWSNALGFMKENMDRWNQIQEESKQPEFKVGDIVIASVGNSDYIGKYKSTLELSDWSNLNLTIGKNNGGTFDTIKRHATPEEIEQFNNLTKIFKMTSSSGDFELEVSKRGIYYKPESAWLNPSDIEQVVKSFRLNCGSINTSVNQSSYTVEYETVKVGCKSGTSIKQWKQVYDYYKSLQ